MQSVPGTTVLVRPSTVVSTRPVPYGGVELASATALMCDDVAADVLKNNDERILRLCMPAPARIDRMVATILNRAFESGYPHDRVDDRRIDDAASNAANPSLPRTRAIGSPRVAAPRRPRTPRGMHV